MTDLHGEAELGALRATLEGRCLSDTTHRDEEHRQSVCMLPEGHAPLMHDDCMGCTWTDADHWQPSAVDRVADEVQRIADESKHEGWDGPLVRILVGRVGAALEGDATVGECVNSNPNPTPNPKERPMSDLTETTPTRHEAPDVAELRRRLDALPGFSSKHLHGGPGGESYIGLDDESGMPLSDSGFDAVLLFAEIAALEVPRLLDRLAHMTEARDNARAEVERLTGQIEAAKRISLGTHLGRPWASVLNDVLRALDDGEADR